MNALGRIVDIHLDDNAFWFYKKINKTLYKYLFFGCDI